MTLTFYLFGLSFPGCGDQATRYVLLWSAKCIVNVRSAGESGPDWGEIETIILSRGLYSLALPFPVRSASRLGGNCAAWFVQARIMGTTHAQLRFAVHGGRGGGAWYKRCVASTGSPRGWGTILSALIAQIRTEQKLPQGQ